MIKAETTQNFPEERRVSRRYRSPEGVFLVENANGSQSIGELLDISADGLSFVYSDDLDALQESTHLNIVTAAGEICVEKVPYRNINDFDYIRKYPFDAYRMRRRGVSFADLSDTQKESLRVFTDEINQR